MLGFGIFFEWSKSLTTDITIHVAESDEEEDADEDTYDEGNFIISDFNIFL